MRFNVLGPLEVRDPADRVVDVGGPRQRAVLARLVVAGGAVVPAERIVDDLWRGEPPPKALGALQAYVSHLRRVLEPDRAPRTPAQVLVSAAPGYALRVAPGDLDDRAFAEEVDAAATAEPARALALLDAALARWRGPAYAGLADEPWARPEAVRLGELRGHARERRAAALLDLGRPGEAVADLEALVHEHRLREEPWRLLALALYRSGRQGEALAALQRARAVLADELGMDPGPALRELEAAVLAHDPALLVTGPASIPAETEPDRGSAPAAVSEPAAPPTLEPAVVGRESELARLHAVADRVRTSRRPGAGLVAGEAGIGKTALIARLAADLSAQGWRVAWGRCPETEGSPALWPWVEVLEALGDVEPDAGEAVALAPLRGGARGALGDEPSARFRQHRALSAYLRRAAARQPLLVVLDDLHRADDGTLTALRDLLADPAPGPLLVLGTYRPTEAGDELTDTLASLARADAFRVTLPGLGQDDVGALVRSVCLEEGMADVEDVLAEGDVVAVIADRSGGNPFYVRETARLLAREGALVAAEEVPAGVRDVVRRHVGRLPEDARLVLRTAAVAGREVDLEVLVAADEHDEEAVHDAVELAVLTGLLVEPGPGRVRFTHALVRDTVYDDLPRLRRSRLHVRVAKALERYAPDDLAGLAHHWSQAAGAGDPARAVHWASAAADQAEQRLAYRASLAHRERALECWALVRDPDPRQEVELHRGLARAQQLAGLATTARVTRGEAVRRSLALGDPRLTARALTAVDVPMLWSNRGYADVDHEIIDTAQATLRALPEEEAHLRVRVLAVLAAESAHWSDPAGAVRTADEAVAVAERTADPALLAVALNAALFVTPRPDPEGRTARVSVQLERLGVEHAMPGVEVLGLLGQIADLCSRAEIDRAAAIVSRAEEVLGRYEMPVFTTLVGLFHAFRESVQGDLAAAARAFELVTSRPSAQQMYDLQAIAAVSRLCLLAQEDRLAEGAEVMEALAASYPGPGSVALAGLRAVQGHREEAADLLRTGPAVPRDYLWLLLQGFRADATVAAGVTDVAEEVYAELLPFERHLCGGETHSMVLGPVATRLARLADLLGRSEDARRHRQVAVEVATLAGSPRWLAEAREG